MEFYSASLCHSLVPADAPFSNHHKMSSSKYSAGVRCYDSHLKYIAQIVLALTSEERQLVQITKTLFATSLSDSVETNQAINKNQAELLFSFFKNCSLFRWSDANNDCEDRANAICILLDEWNIPNYKGWVFSGYVFKKIGYLKNLWKYHVAAAVPVEEGDEVNIYIIDPATTGSLMKAEDWAANVTDNPHSYYLIKSGNVYIFPSKINKDKWHERNKRNYKWTIQGLSGVNGVSTKGKAQLRFNKKRLLKTRDLFNELRKNKPSFLNPTDDAYDNT